MIGGINMGRLEKICILCPIGCNLIIEKDPTSKEGYKVSGNRCNRGFQYAIKEMTNPTRVLTSTVRIKGFSNSMLPVRTDVGIPKNKMLQIMDEIRYLEIETPINAGDIIAKNICNTNANLIATKSIG
ncbi:conserved hypothetical protein [[Clostridium] ultunense Esp]|nr:DUF1667 domain-containing protein [Clostridium sp. Cult1]CCQ95532.1 conserved hypothetical protein [[Clostridium] ultunense Esp]